MFPCPECDKSYINQTSLTRHRHNHDRTKQHICPICNVVFFRRDLLSRHARMHDASSLSSSNQADSSLSPTAAVKRKRSHTACESCRTARSKCDANQPCSNCADLGSTCVYSANKKRMSETISRTAGTRLQECEPVFEFGGPSLLETGSHFAHASCHDTNVASAVSSSLSANFPRPVLNGCLFEHATGQALQAAPAASSLRSDEVAISSSLDLLSTATPWDPNSWDDMTSWPWLHEDMFLTSQATSWIDTNAHAFDFLYNASPDKSLEDNTKDQSYQADFPEPQIPVDEQYSVAISQIFPTAMESRSDEQKQPVVRPEDSINTADPSSLYTPPPSTSNCGMAGSSGTALPNVRQSFEDNLLAEYKTAAQLRLVEELVAYASNSGRSSDWKTTWQFYLRSMSIRVHDVFGFHEEQTSDKFDHNLKNFIGLWSQHFGSLWPLLPRWNLDYDSLQPVLYLTLVSIGAMYSGTRQKNFATVLHEQIRRTLLSTALELEETDSEEDFLWLAQARSLTQVAALYFGQVKAFSYAHHLGGTLVAQSRRMSLFSAQPDVFLQIESQDAFIEQPERILRTWLMQESRKRLAFGMLRAEAYTSVLLSSRPLVSSDELELELPCSESLWLRDFGTAAEYLEAIKKERRAVPLIFAELQRVIMDREESIPMLEPIGYELSLFGLQEAAWRVYQNRTMRKRSSSNKNSPSHTSGYIYGSSRDPLAVPPREMKDLILDQERLLHAIEKWKISFDTCCRAQDQLQKGRSSVLSSLLLYHITHLCLHAPINDLHQILYRLGSNRPLDPRLLRDMHTWTQTPSAQVAAEQGCTIWSIIFYESQRAKDSRARFNFLAFIGLHHAAAVIWAYANSREDSGAVNGQGKPLKLEAISLMTESLTICKRNSQDLMKRFIYLYQILGPSRWSSFATAAVKLSQISQIQHFLPGS